MNEHSNILLYSQEAEEALLGSALIDPGVLRETDISPSDFFIQRNGMIWAALLSLDKGHGGLDILSLSEVLSRRNQLDQVGGNSYLAGGDLTIADLDGIGLRVAIYPGLGRYAAGYGMREALGALKRDGSTRAARDRMLTGREYNEVLKLPEIEAWEKKYLA